MASILHSNGIAMNSFRACATAEQQMTQLHHLQTPNEERSARAAAKQRAIQECKRLATIGALERLRQKTEAVLVDLKNAAALLDGKHRTRVADQSYARSS
jgi:hypothetical protein